MVQRRVRQQHAQIGTARRDGVRGHRRPRSRPDTEAPPQEDHRPHPPGEQFPLHRIDVHQVFDVPGVPRHQRERLVAPGLAAAQRGHRLRAGGVAGEVVAADALDRDHRARGEQRRRRAHGVVAGRERHVRAGGAGDQPQPRTARRTADWLRVEAPVAGVLVLPGAVGAQREARHRGVRTVVRQPGDDRETRPAVRTGDERMAVAPVAGVAELGQTVGAGRGVGCHERPYTAAGAGGDDAEAALPGDGQFGGLHRLHHRERRRVRRDARAEPLDGRRRALDLRHHPFAGVRHVPRQTEAGGQPVDVRPEPHPLHHAPHDDPRTPRGAGVRRRRGTDPGSGAHASARAITGAWTASPSAAASARSTRTPAPSPVRTDVSTTSTPGLTRST